MTAINDFSVRTDQVVIGQNPENADYVNRRGDIYGFAAYVQSESEYGDRRELFVGTYATDEQATQAGEALAVKLRRRLAAGKLPVGFARWREGRPCYGSQAYVDYGQADDIALERREAEDE